MQEGETSRMGNKATGGKRGIGREERKPSEVTKEG